MPPPCSLKSLNLDELKLDELHELVVHVNEEYFSRLKVYHETFLNDVHQQRKELESEKAEWQEMEQKLQRTQINKNKKRVKLDVGGKIFSTSLDNLLMEENSYFSALFSGRWEIQVDEEEGTIFIDRDPIVFGYILQYLRGEDIFFEGLTKIEFLQLKKDADYYQLIGLLELMREANRKYVPGALGNIILTSGGRIAKKTSDRGWDAITVGPEFEFTHSKQDYVEQRVRILSGSSLLIGLAPSSIQHIATANYSNCGYYLSQYEGKLWSQNGDFGKNYRGASISINSVIGVRYHNDKSVSFSVDSNPYEKAFFNLSGGPFVLAIFFYHKDDCVELLC